MRRVLRNSLVFLDLPAADILSAGFLIMLLLMLSGVFGLIRDRLLAANFTPDLVGVYFAAFVIPENLLQILVLSAMTSAFIPIFTKYEREGTQWEFTQSLLWTSLAIFLVVTALVFLFVEPLSLGLFLGIEKENPAHTALFVNLTRIILLTQLFFIPSYIFTGILQSQKRFLIPALCPIFYNIGIILGFLFFVPHFGLYGVAIGVLIGAMLHFSIQLPSVVRLGLRMSATSDLFHPGVWEVAKLAYPRAISMAIERAKVTIDTSLAALISLASITYLNFALHVATFPVSLVASAIGQAALPFFAKSVASNNLEEFKTHMRTSLTHILFLLAPLSVLLIVFHTPVVRLVFGAPLFSLQATVLTSQTLAILSFSLVMQGAATILARGFYAFFDTKMPLLLTLVSMATSTLLSIVFVVVFKFDVRALAASSAIGSTLNAFLLFVLLGRKVGGFTNTVFFRAVGKILFVSLLLGGFSYTIFKVFERYFNTSYTLPLLIFTLLVGLASILFFLLFSVLFQLEEYHAIVAFFKRAAKLRTKLLKETTV